jgi:hypothetical protein
LFWCSFCRHVNWTFVNGIWFHDLDNGLIKTAMATFHSLSNVMASKSMMPFFTFRYRSL